MDFNDLPFVCEKEASTHRISEKCVEFYDEPKLCLHLYSERAKPYLSNWFAITSDWFPEDKYIVFDKRVVIDTSKGTLSYTNGEKALTQLADLIIDQYDNLLEFVRAVSETKGVNGAAIEAKSKQEKPCLSSDSKWDALQPISKKILSMWYQTDKEEYFLTIRDVVRDDEIDLKILNECLTHVREHEVDIFNSFCKQENKKP